MRFWALVVLEFSWSCHNCGRVINYGEPAFLLIDAGLIQLREEKQSFAFESLLCFNCMKERFPDLASAF